MVKTIYKYDAEDYNNALAEAIKNIPEMEAPEWSFYVKSGVSKQRVPENEDFWYKRAASILRQVYIKGVIGVEKLRTRYGCRKDKGGKPDKFKKSSGKIIRTILMQAEVVGLVEKINIGNQHGRRLTQKGRDFLDSIEVKETKTKEPVSEIKEKPAKIIEEVPQGEVEETKIEKESEEVIETKQGEVENGKETQQEE